MPSAWAVEPVGEQQRDEQVTHPAILAIAARGDYGLDRRRRGRRSGAASSVGPAHDAALPVGPLATRAGHVVRHGLEREIVERDEDDLGRARSRDPR